MANMLMSGGMSVWCRMGRQERLTGGDINKLSSVIFKEK